MYLRSASVRLQFKEFRHAVEIHIVNSCESKGVKSINRQTHHNPRAVRIQMQAWASMKGGY